MEKKEDIIIAPSVLALDYSCMEKQVEELNQSGAKWLHFDVMDGHFVPALTFGPEILKGFKHSSPLFMDVHLMVENPEQFIEPFVKNGADLITFHTESLDNDLKACQQLIDKIHDAGVQAGFSIKPSTDIESFEALLPSADCILVMSVEPGKGGQSFMEEQLHKVRWLKNHQEPYHFQIEIDGGINNLTAPKALESGAQVLVSGSYLFGRNLKEGVDSLLPED